MEDVSIKGEAAKKAICTNLGGRKKEVRMPKEQVSRSSLGGRRMLRVIPAVLLLFSPGIASRPVSTFVGIVFYDHV